MLQKPNQMTVADELKAAVGKILESKSRKKLVVAGPGAGKTWLFRELLKIASGKQDTRLVVTFIKNLRVDLERSLGNDARVFTLHAYCQHLLYGNAALRNCLTRNFKCYPKLLSLIKTD